MTLKRLFLASGSVLVLTAAGALADNNEAWLEQVGTNNSASIDQSLGSDNTAGRSGVDTSVGQDGDDNTLTLTQSGNDN